jgi:Flp pilus assembly protein TadD
MGRRFVSLVFALILFSLPLRAASSPWVEVRSQHFSVITDAGEKQGHEVALRFEQMRAIFGTLFSKSKLNAPTPLQVVAFRTQDGFMPYVPRVKGTPVSLASFLETSDDGNFIALDISSPDAYTSAARDYSRLLLRENFPVMPAWFEEGFAEYFSTIKVTGQQVEYGNPPAQYTTVLANPQWTPIATVFATTREKMPQADALLIQAESWLAVRYLFANNRLVDAFKYLQLAQIQHVPPADAIEQAFGADAASFEKQLRDSVVSNNSVTHSGLPEIHDDPYSTKKLTDPQAQGVLADVHAHSDQYFQQALTELQSVLKSDSNSRVANRALGYWYLRNNQPPQAEAPLARAISLNDVDLQAHYLLGATLLKREAQEGNSKRLTLNAEQELGRAIDLDREFAAPRSAMASALFLDGKFDDAIQSAKQAIALYPGEEQFQAQLAHVYILTERWDSARAVLTRLQSSDNPAIRDKATETLASLEATRQQAAAKKKEREAAMRDPTASKWKMTPEVAAENARESSDDDSANLDKRKTLFLSGELLSIDCSHQPEAFVTVRKSQKTIRLYTGDYAKLIVMGSDEFSCDWRNKKVLVNYKPGGHADGDLVSLEVQGQ